MGNESENEEPGSIFDATDDYEVLQEVLAEKEIRQTEMYFTEEWGWIVTFYGPILNSSDKVVGIVAADYLVADFLQDIKNIRLKTSENENLIMTEIKGDVNFYPESKKFEVLGNLEMDFSLLGTISSKFDEFAAQLRILSLSNEIISSKPLQIVCDYSNKTFNAQILQNTVPVHLSATYNTELESASVTLQTDKFEPLSFVRIKNKKDVLNKFVGSKLSGIYKFNYEGQQKQINY